MFANRPRSTEVRPDAVALARAELVAAEAALDEAYELNADEAEIRFLEGVAAEAEDRYFDAVDMAVDAEMAAMERMMDLGLSPF